MCISQQFGNQRHDDNKLGDIKKKLHFLLQNLTIDFYNKAALKRQWSLILTKIKSLA